MNIVEFLTARLDEREATAKATTPGPWGDHAPGSVYVEQSAVDDGHLVAEFPTCEDHEDRREADAAHIALNDPVYVLADIAAKRRILALHQPGGQFSELRDASQYYCATCGSGEAYEYPTDWPCETLLLLAGPFAAHPDFDPAWAVPTS